MVEFPTKNLQFDDVDSRSLAVRKQVSRSQVIQEVFIFFEDQE